MVVIAIISVLTAILLPVLAQCKAGARRTQCIDNLRQIGIATHLYWNDHDDMTFRYLAGSTNGGRVYWFGWIKPGAEGDREFDPQHGALNEYLGDNASFVCPSLDYQATLHKLKARSGVCNYGYNRHLGRQSISLSRVVDTAQTVLFADSAQVNDFQAPASPERPLLEEFYYVDADEGLGYPNTHFRHNRQAQATFVDGHVGAETAAPNSFDPRLPNQYIGRLRNELVLIP